MLYVTSCDSNRVDSKFDLKYNFCNVKDSVTGKQYRMNYEKAVNNSVFGVFKGDTNYHACATSLHFIKFLDILNDIVVEEVELKDQGTYFILANFNFNAVVICNDAEVCTNCEGMDNCISDSLLIKINTVTIEGYDLTKTIYYNRFVCFTILDVLTKIFTSFKEKFLSLKTIRFFFNEVNLYTGRSIYTTIFRVNNTKEIISFLSKYVLLGEVQSLGGI